MPVVLASNQPRQFYRGGQRIAELRGTPAIDGHRPEDWIASTTRMFGRPEGMSTLPDGRALFDAVEADPVGFLGQSHHARFGTDTALLVKLLDAGERLPVHVHPDRAFAARHLGCAHGKTEAWIVLDAAQDASVHLGFRESVDEQTFGRWLETQDGAAMLAAMNKLTVGPGTGVLVPAGTPHAIGEGVFVVELQEPADFSILLEWQAFGLPDRSNEQLGLPAETALSCVDRSRWDDEKVAGCVSRLDDGAQGVQRMLPEQADPFFRAEQISGRPAKRLDPQFAVLIVTNGTGNLESAEGTLRIQRGNTILVPYSAGETTVTGDVSLIRCMPPSP